MKLIHIYSLAVSLRAFKFPFCQGACCAHSATHSHSPSSVIRDNVASLSLLFLKKFSATRIASSLSLLLNIKGSSAKPHCRLYWSNGAMLVMEVSYKFDCMTGAECLALICEAMPISRPAIPFPQCSQSFFSDNQPFGNPYAAPCDR